MRSQRATNSTTRSGAPSARDSPALTCLNVSLELTRAKTMRLNKNFPPVCAFLALSFFHMNLAAAPATPEPAPPREIPLVEKKFDALSDKNPTGDGQTALAISPDKWKHAE